MIRSEGDQHGGNHQVHGGTHHVEGGFVIDKLHLVGVETAVDPIAQGSGEDMCHALHAPLAEADDGTGCLGRTEHLVALVLTGQVHGGLDHILGFLGSTHCHDHDDAGCHQIERRSLGTLHQRFHHERVYTGTMGVGGIVLIGSQTGQGHTDEVHKVVAGKGHGKTKGAHEHDKLEDVDTAQMEYFHDDGGTNEGIKQEQVDVVVDIVAHVLTDIGTVAHAFHEDEVSQYGEGDTAEDGDGVAAVLLVVEREDDTADPHHDHTDDERDGHTDEDGDDHAQGLVGVEQHAIVEAGVTHDLQCGDHKRAAEELKDQRHGGRRGHS